MAKSCKRCLLLEAGEKSAYENIKSYLKTLDVSEMVDDSIYKQRLGMCSSCDYLISGMCRKCGCYAEVRAALKDSECPDADNRKW